MKRKEKQMVGIMIALAALLFASVILNSVNTDPLGIMQGPDVGPDGPELVEPDPPCPRPGACEVIDWTGGEE